MGCPRKRSRGVRGVSVDRPWVVLGVRVGRALVVRLVFMGCP